jgi:hypothetical protein
MTGKKGGSDHVPRKVVITPEPCVSVLVILASFFQWWNISFDGKLLTKRWVHVLLVVVTILLSAAIILLFV